MSATGEQSFSDIGNITIAADGSLWISHLNEGYAEGRASCVRHLKPDGSLIAQLGRNGSKIGAFAGPDVIA